MKQAAEYSEIKKKLLEKYLSGDLEFRPAVQTVPPRNPAQPIPLSYAQEQTWLHAQLVPQVPLYNEPVTIHYTGELDVVALEKSFNEVFRRHEAWRTYFALVEGQPIQVVKADLNVSLPVVDLRPLPKEQREAAALAIATADARKPIDLKQAPLFRSTLVQLDDQEYRLYLTLSHIIFDGVAIYCVFLPELSRLYEAYAAGKPSPLTELPFQYPDFTCWQRQSARPDEFAPHVAYWRNELRELPTLDLPSDRPRPPVQTYRGSMYPFVLNDKVLRAVRLASRQEGVTLFQFLLSSFAALLARYSGQDHFPIGSVTAGREVEGSQALLGYFLNTVVLRTDVSGNPSFRELLKRMRRVTLEALEHDCVSFGRLIQELSPVRDLSRNPIFQVMFSLEPPMPVVNPAWRLTQMDVDTGATKYDLYLELDDRNEEILARFHYSTDLFDRTTVERMARHWMKLLEGAAEDPGRTVAELPLSEEAEKHQLLIEWNETREDYPRNKCIHEIFDETCGCSGDAVAVRHREANLTFRQLQERSNRLANHLLAIGAGPKTRVALHVDRSPGMFVGLLAILKAGAAYVPLDPSYPSGRLGFILEDAGAAVLITQKSLRNKLPRQSAKVVCLDADWDQIAGQSMESPVVDVRAGDPAYVIYTSGSSGKPKGVEGTHRGVMNRCAWMWKEYPFGVGEKCCQKTNLGFVDSVWEIFGPLLAGIGNVIVEGEVVRDPEELLRMLAKERVTRMVVVPSLLRSLLDQAPNLGERVPELKLWSCSGEVLTGELAKRFVEGFPEAKLLNIYGSSEVGADVTWHEVKEGEELRGGGSVAIGRPISNTQVYVVDERQEVVPIGVRGEIVVGGDGLALGYWNRPELTAERFVRNGVGGRLYRTGDLGRYRGDGEIEYLGRVDGQVKLRGMRIELGEIEAVLGTHPGVREAAIVVEGEGEQQKLAAYVVMREGGESVGVGGRELGRYLRTKLPEHMVPVSYWQVERMPELPSGKVNRKLLAEGGGKLGVLLREGGGKVTAPGSEVERKLAEIWEELLEVEEVGVDQNFFEMGGHSLLVLQVIARIRRMFEVEMPVRSVFEEPTIAGLAAEVQKAQAQGLKARRPIVQRSERTTAANPSREALLAQLDGLSATELQSLLKSVLDGKPA